MTTTRLATDRNAKNGKIGKDGSDGRGGGTGRSVPGDGPDLYDGLRWLLRRGVTLSLAPDGAHVVLHGPNARRTERVRAWVKRHRWELVAHLREGTLYPRLTASDDAELRFGSSEADSESAMIAAAQSGRLPCCEPPLALPFGLRVTDPNPFVLLALDRWRIAANDYWPWETYPGSEPPRSCETVAAELSAVLDAVRSWWKEASCPLLSDARAGIVPSVGYDEGGQHGQAA
jgi:hypothetical protein